MKTEADIRKLLDTYIQANRRKDLTPDLGENTTVAILVGEAILSWVLDVPVLDPITQDPIPNPVDADAKSLQSFIDSL